MTQTQSPARDGRLVSGLLHLDFAHVCFLLSRSIVDALQPATVFPLTERCIPVDAVAVHRSGTVGDFQRTHLGDDAYMIVVQQITAIRLVAVRQIVAAVSRFSGFVDDLTHKQISRFDLCKVGHLFPGCVVTAVDAIPASTSPADRTDDETDAVTGAIRAAAADAIVRFRSTDGFELLQKSS